MSSRGSKWHRPPIGASCGRLRAVVPSLRFAGIALAIIAAPPAAAAPPAPLQPLGMQSRSIATPVAVFGTDNRKPVPARLARVSESVGLFFSNQSRTVCSAFCVAPGIIATAAHCLAQPGGRPARLADFTFARGYDRIRDYAKIEGHANGSSTQSMIVGDFQYRVKPPIDAAHDWALIRLARPVCKGHVLPVAQLSTPAIIADAAAGRVFQLSYHRDWTQWRIAFSEPCSVARSFNAIPWSSIAPDFLNADQMLLHQCDTGGASSGSPLIVERDGAFAVVAINVGTYVQAKILTERGQVTLREKAETVANTAVNASVLAGRIELLETANILASGPRLRTLQQHLTDQRLYQSTIDGSYGPMLKTAIESYERVNRLPITGLPTETLLKRLAKQANGLGEVAPSSAPRQPRLP